MPYKSTGHRASARIGPTQNWTNNATLPRTHNPVAKNMIKIIKE